jgi:ribonucleoside-diphosphate reductase alpha chain
MEKWYESSLGKTLLAKKYFHENEDFKGFINRVTSIFSAELAPKVRTCLLNGEFFPAGRSLYGAGSKGKFRASMSNCYILPSPEDNIESIYDVNKKMARIFSYGGGCGVNISKLRPKNTKVNNSARTSSGAVSFLSLFNATGSVIGTHGRRAAEMVALSCEHPDVEEFLKIKQNDVKLEAMNISMLLTTEFMEAVKADKPFELHFDIPETGEHIRRKISARKFFREYCQTQWDYGDPGSIFIDRVRSFNLLSGYPEYKIDVSNPCAEFYGNAYNSCNLGSINLYHLIDHKFEPDAAVNYDKLRATVDTAVRALDEILDYGYDMQPLDENRKCIDDWRSIGLGIMGLADMFVALGIRYGSLESREVASDMMEAILKQALITSCDLARTKGAFGKFDWEKTSKSQLIQMFPELQADIQKYGLRNGTLLSIAPTGSLSLLAGSFSGGVEPIYQISMQRTTHSMEKEKKSFRVFAHSVHELLEHDKLPLNTPDAEIKARYPFIIESHDIDPRDRIVLQGILQSYVDNAISSTVNLKESATVEEIEHIYLMAYEQGCKGITVFRDNCKRGSILDVNEKSEIALDSLVPAKRHNIKRIDGSTFRKSSACIKNYYITVNKTSGGQIFEVFTNFSGGCTANVDTMTRLISLLLRTGVKVDTIISELREAKCRGCQELRKQGKDVSLSCGNAIADAIEEAYRGTTTKTIVGGVTCPECGAKMLPEGRCWSCPNCGFSKCND